MTSTDDTVVQTFMKSVVFVCKPTVEEPLGTGFLVSIYDHKNKCVWPFLVTNKHVIEDLDRYGGIVNGRQLIDPIEMRFNQLSSNKFVRQKIDVERHLFVHQDESVDLAIISFTSLIDSNQVDLDVSVLFGNLKSDCVSLVEGRDAITASLLQGYPGLEQNYPVCRFGKISLITSERWCDAGRGFGKESAWLIDLGTYEGASGSPVFLNPIQMEMIPNGLSRIMYGGTALIGVVKAVYNSPHDHFAQLRALTPIEPIKHLQDIFSAIRRGIELQGFEPSFTQSQHPFVKRKPEQGYRSCLLSLE